ncbi:hypothetical protein [Desulfobacter postgatei]|uniref:hypothetical protein n=1 Tax=Desulfobacter postgatei TaxID=2293 RepID=UPI00030CFEE8|nr:hypothetical protein [Desulfobacter postgatei]
MDQLLDDIQALKEEILKRIEAIAKGETEIAQNLFDQFCKQKYNRHTAFKREVRSVIAGSRLLKTLNPVF